MIQNLQNSVNTQSSFNRFILNRGLIEIECTTSKVCLEPQFILKSRLYNIDEKIVKNLQDHFNSNEDFNIFSIYSRSFEKSYSKAIIEISLNTKNNSLKNKMLVIGGALHSSSNFSLLPKEIIFSILGIENLLTERSLSRLPSCNDFQAKMFSLIDPINDKSKIIKQLKT